MIFYFSASGNSLWLAQQLATATNDNLVNMADALLKDKCSFVLQRNENIGFVLPVYGWDLPPIVRQFISQMELQEQTENYLFLACTCGDDSGRMLQRFRRELRPKNLHVHSAFALRMPNTYVCLPGFDVDSPVLTKEKLHAAPLRIKQIAQSIILHEKGIFQTRPGSFPRLKTHVLGRFFQAFLMTDKPFHTTSACTSCGICVHSCPLRNILLQDGHPQWNGHCTGCLSCYHHCPTHAIAFGRHTKNKGQYLLKNVLSDSPLDQ
ncbi:MAG: EFR1 family ferrodoxin [Bacteroidaceae bacterium]|jgi:Pyruvate/2-oxoacid:ferredoxin oxidoreductase delta subunit